MTLTRLTTLTLYMLDPDSALIDPGHDRIVGMAVLTGDVSDRTRFALHTLVAEPGEAPDLGDWLDRHLPADGIVAGYDLGGGVLPLLEMMDIDPVERLIKRYCLLELSDKEKSFFEACYRQGIGATYPDPDARFIDWAFGRTDRILDALQLDAIATWRLALMRLSPSATRLGPAFDRWLSRSGLTASLRQPPLAPAA